MQFPPELLNQIGVILEMFVAGITALTVAFWIALVIWTLRDIPISYARYICMAPGRPAGFDLGSDRSAALSAPAAQAYPCRGL